MSEILTKIKAAAKARQMDYAQLPSLLNWREEDFRAIWDERKTPSKKQLNELATLLGVYPRSFYVGDLKLKDLPVDFRTNGNKPAILSLKSRLLLDQAILLAKFANDYSVSNQAFKPFIEVELTDDTTEVGTKVRSRLEITDELQIQTSDAQFYNFVSDQIQKESVFVFCRTADVDDFRGFTTRLEPNPLIVINSALLSKKAQIFTLIHEFVHLLLGKTGVSDPFSSDSNIERFCNAVAAAALAPSRLMQQILRLNPYNRGKKFEFVRYFSNQLNVSFQCALIRLIELGIVDRNFLSADSLAQFYKKTDFLKNKGGGGGGGDYNYGANQIWRNGARFALELARAADVGKLALIDIEATVGLSESGFVSLVEQAIKRFSDQLGEDYQLEIASFDAPGETYVVDAA